MGLTNYQHCKSNLIFFPELIILLLFIALYAFFFHCCLSSHWNQTRRTGEPKLGVGTFGSNSYGCCYNQPKFILLLDNRPPHWNWKQWANLPKGNSRTGTRTGRALLCLTLIHLEDSQLFVCWKFSKRQLSLESVQFSCLCHYHICSKLHLSNWLQKFLKLLDPEIGWTNFSPKQQRSVFCF